MTRSWILLLALTFPGCGKPANCEPGFDPGEQFRITIKGPTPNSEICDESLLKPGDSFILTASSVRIPDVTSAECYTLGAVGEVPEFASTIITRCWSGRGQLGLSCDGMAPTGCAITMSAHVGPYISRSVDVVEDGLFVLNWGGCQLPQACYGSQVFSARIERLTTRGDY